MSKYDAFYNYLKSTWLANGGYIRWGRMESSKCSVRWVCWIYKMKIYITRTKKNVEVNVEAVN